METTRPGLASRVSKKKGQTNVKRLIAHVEVTLSKAAVFRFIHSHLGERYPRGDGRGRLQETRRRWKINSLMQYQAHGGQR